MQVLTTAELAVFFASITSPSFVSLRGYKSTTSGEVADHRLNVGLTYKKVQEADVKDYQAALDNGTFANEPELKAACETLLAAVKANLNEETRSSQSKGATANRVALSDTASVFYNEISGELFIQGYTKGKKVLVPGTPKKEVKSKPETIAKNKVKKILGIRQASWRTWNIGCIKAVRAKGQALVIDVCD